MPPHAPVSAWAEPPAHESPPSPRVLAGKCGSHRPTARFIEYNCVLCAVQASALSRSLLIRPAPLAGQRARQLAGIRHARRSFGAPQKSW